MMSGIKQSPLLERLEAKIQRIPFSGCWIWTGHTTCGYGIIRVNVRQERVHRLMFLLAGGTIPKGKEINHLCEVRACCNPAHLEAVTRSENIKYSYDPSRNPNPPKDVCARGHARTPENVYNRQCKLCRRETIRVWMRQYRAKGKVQS